MKKIIILGIAFIDFISANCQNDKKLSDYFSDVQNENITMYTRSIRSLNTNNPLDTTVALKYFFDNDIKKMHDVFEGYNPDENTYTYTHYTKKVYPLYRLKKENICLLCYKIEAVIYLSLYDYETDTIGNTFVLADSPDEGDDYTAGIIFSNNYIATIQVAVKSYYILSKIDYETQKFIEVKKIEIDNNQSDYAIMNNVFEELGISETGELLEDNP
jgi:hypothetical protein